MADSRYTRRLEPVTFHKILTKESALMAKFSRQCTMEERGVQYGIFREYLRDNGIQPTFGRDPQDSIAMYSG